MRENRKYIKYKKITLFFIIFIKSFLLQQNKQQPVFGTCFVS